MAATITPNEVLLSLPWMMGWLAEIGYQPEQVKSLDVETDIVRDFEAEKGMWKMYKPGKQMHLMLRMTDGTNHGKSRDLWG